MKTEMGGAHKEERRSAYKVLVGRPEGKRTLARPGIHGRIILKLIFKKSDGGMDWIDLARNWDRWRAVVKAVMNVRVPLIAGNFLTNCEPVSFSRMTLLHEGGVSYDCRPIGPPICM